SKDSKLGQAVVKLFCGLHKSVGFSSEEYADLNPQYISTSEKEIARCKVFVPIITRNSTLNVMLRSQIAFAAKARKPIFPLLARDYPESMIRSTLSELGYPKQS